MVLTNIDTGREIELGIDEINLVIDNYTAQRVIQKLLWSISVNGDSLDEFMKRQLTFIVEEASEK